MHDYSDCMVQTSYNLNVHEQVYWFLSKDYANIWMDKLQAVQKLETAATGHSHQWKFIWYINYHWITTLFDKRCASMKLFKIKAIKTYVSYITIFAILSNMHTQKEKKMVSSEDAVQYSPKDKLIRSETVSWTMVVVHNRDQPGF